MRYLIAGVVCGLSVLGGCEPGRVARPSGDPAVDSRQAIAFAKRAEEAQMAGQPDEAVNYAKQALTLRSDLGGAWNNLGVSLMDMKEWIAASDALRKAADYMPSDPRPYENLGNLYRRQGFSVDALKYFVLSLERDPYWLPSIRGATASAKDLLHSDDDGLERVKRGLLVDNDPDWRRIYESERVRIKQDLDEKLRRLKSGL